MRRALALTSTMLVALAAAGVAQAVQPGSLTSLPPAAVSTPAASSWADPQIRAVTAVGILGNGVAGFRASDPLTRGELADALVAWGKAAPAPADPAKLVTMSELDSQLVGALGLLPAARRIRIAARDAELAPPSRLGTETVARLLGLRLDHPVGSDDLELGPYAARDAGRSCVLAGSRDHAHDRPDRLARPAEHHVFTARARRVAACRARSRAEVRRISVRVGRHLGDDSEAVERDRGGRFRNRARRASIARASSGASTRRSRFPARRCSATSSRDGRPSR